MNSELSPSEIRAIAFDFDGVIAVPWTNPETPFPQVRALLNYLVKNNIKLAVTSFNPNAHTALAANDLLKYFDAVRAGCNHWWDYSAKSTVYQNNLHRKQLCKSRQIADIVLNEWKSANFEPKQVLLIDDDKNNIMRAQIAGFQTLFVEDSFLGPDWTSIAAMLPHISEPTIDEKNLMCFPRSTTDIALVKISLENKFMSLLKYDTPSSMNSLLVQLGTLTKNHHQDRREEEKKNAQHVPEEDVSSTLKPLESNNGMELNQNNNNNTKRQCVNVVNVWSPF